MAKPRVKGDADGEGPAAVKEGPGAAETTGASVGVMVLNSVVPEAETGRGAEMGMVSGAEAWTGSVEATETGSEDDTGTVEDTGLVRGEELGTGTGEEAGPGREEETVRGAAPGAEAVEKYQLGLELFFYFVPLPHPFLSAPKLHLFPRIFIYFHTIKSKNQQIQNCKISFPSKFPINIF